MLGCHQGFATRIRDACTALGGKGVIVAWCGSHQLNLAVDAFFKELDDLVNFRKALSAEISFTRRYDTVRAVVGECPTYASTRWDSIHDSCHFLSAHCEVLMHLQQEKLEMVLSPDTWWLSLFIVTEITESLRHCFKSMQFKTVTMNEQYGALRNLVNVLQLKYERDNSAEEVITTSVCKEKVKQRLMYAAFNSTRLYDRLSEAQGAELVDGIEKAISLLVSRVKRIQIQVKAEAIPFRTPETPKDVVECDPRHFNALLELHSARLRSRFGPAVCNKIWSERNDLTSRYHSDSSFRRRVEGVNNLQFGEAWKQLDKKLSSSRLLSFIAGLAARAPGTHTVEGDFSSLKLAKNSQRACLSNYAMEGQLQAKQHFELLTLAERIKSQEKV